MRKLWFVFLLGAVLVAGCDKDAPTKPQVPAPCDTVEVDDDDGRDVNTQAAFEVYDAWIDRNSVVHIRATNTEFGSPRRVVINNEIELVGGEFAQVWHPARKWVEAQFPVSSIGGLVEFSFVVYSWDAFYGEREIVSGVLPGEV